MLLQRLLRGTTKTHPLKLPSLHCRSGLAATNALLTRSDAAGRIPAPNVEGDETAVPANSTPIAPSPVVELYLLVYLDHQNQLNLNRRTNVVVSLGSALEFSASSSIKINDDLRARSDTQFAWLSPSSARSEQIQRTSEIDTRKDDGIPYFVFIQVIQYTLAVGAVSVPIVLGKCQLEMIASLQECVSQDPLKIGEF